MQIIKNTVVSLHYKMYDADNQLIDQTQPEEPMTYLHGGYDGIFPLVEEQLQGKQPIFIPDPGAEKDAIDAAKSCGGRVLQFPDKVDDYVLRHKLDGDWLRSAVKSARVAR